MILNGIKVYNITKTPIKTGDIVVFIKKYPALFEVGDKTIITKVYVKETGTKMIDYVMVKDMITENTYLVSTRLIRKCSYYERKTYQYEQQLIKRAKRVGKGI